MREAPWGAIALSYPPRVRVGAMAKLSAAFFHDESSITIGGYESAIAPLRGCRFLYFFSLCDVRNKPVFLLLEHPDPRGLNRKNT